MFDRVFNIKPDHRELANLDPTTTLQLKNIEYIVESLRPIVLTMDPQELKAFPSKISNYVRLRSKPFTPVKPPKIIVFYHPARTELRAYLKNLADYFDLKTVTMEHVLIEQREKLKRLGPNCHEVMTKRLEVPDDVVYIAYSDRISFHAVRARFNSLPLQRLANE